MFRSKIAGRAMLKLIVRQRVNLVSADLPGPQTPLYFAGAQLLEVFPLLNLLGNVSLGVGALSYAGQLNIMAVADRDAHPRPRGLRRGCPKRAPGTCCISIGQPGRHELGGISSRSCRPGRWAARAG